jgi:hypothetical protein
MTVQMSEVTTNVPDATGATSPVLRPKRAMVSDAVSHLADVEASGNMIKAPSHSGSQHNKTSSNHAGATSEYDNSDSEDQDDASVVTDRSLYEQLLNDDVDEFDYAKGRSKLHTI